MVSEDGSTWRAACGRLTARFGAADSALAHDSEGMAPGSAVQAVALAIETGLPVDAEDTRAGLMLIARARDCLYAYEHRLIDHARACGLTWDEIGQLLGIGDRRAARTRYQRLTERLQQPRTIPPGQPQPTREEAAE